MTSTHIANGVAFFALAITGILLLPAPFSGLREILLGGRFETVVDVHLWASVPFVLTLAIVYVLRGWKILRLGRITPLVGWKKLNSIFALALSALLIVTGVVLWIRPETAAGWMDISRSVHTWSTWAVIPWVLLHAGVETARWLKRWARATPSFDRLRTSGPTSAQAELVEAHVHTSQALPICSEEVKTQ